jgi:hypothetical protein
MNRKVRQRILLALTLCLGAASLAGCASSSDMDGGIVGTGNRIDCAAISNKQPPAGSLPRECQ